jgi:hypothetical protein
MAYVLDVFSKLPIQISSQAEDADPDLSGRHLKPEEPCFGIQLRDYPIYSDYFYWSTSRAKFSRNIGLALGLCKCHRFASFSPKFRDYSASSHVFPEFPARDLTLRYNLRTIEMRKSLTQG